MRTILVFLLFTISLARPEIASAQPELGLDLGAVVPVADLSKYRTVGVSAVLSAGFGTAHQRWASRAEVGYQHIFGPSPPPFALGDNQRDDVSLVSLRASAIRTFARNPEGAVYGLFGIGAYALKAKVDDSMGGGPGIHLGLGARIKSRGSTVNVEVQGVAIASEYATTEFAPAIYVPMSLGVRF